MYKRLEPTRLHFKFASNLVPLSDTDRKILLVSFVYYIAVSTWLLYETVVTVDTTEQILLAAGFALALYVPLFFGLIFTIRFAILTLRDGVRGADAAAYWQDVVDTTLVCYPLPQTVAVAMLLVSGWVLARGVPPSGSLKRLLDQVVVPIVMIAALLQLAATFL